MTSTQKKVLHGVELKPRSIIHPTKEVKVATPEAKSQVVQAVRRVMTTHDKALRALKDRRMHRAYYWRSYGWQGLRYPALTAKERWGRDMGSHGNHGLWGKFFLCLFVAVTARGLHAQPQDAVTYVYTDPQGTPLAETDAHGNITKTFEYTPYGTYAPRGTSALAPTPQGPAYTGHVNDPETNLVYMQARYYDPATGHFLSIDPVAPAGGDTFNFNRYAYADNNPTVRTDPNGRESASLTLQGLSAIEQDQAQQPAGEVAQAQSMVLGAVPGVGDIQNIHDAFQNPTGINITAAIIGLAPDGGALTSQVLKEVKIAKEATPLIKAGAAGGETAGKAFPRAVKDAAKAENPTATCVFCRREGTATQVDHAVPKARGGNATLENAQLSCPHCNASKGARDLPVNPPPGYKGTWPPPPPPHQ